ncbi:MAG: caspase family protein [Saprospiraceae bacterium]|nr:caspase family protein [Saprospiraceae bacterium]MDW8482730.1 caspase family protein [Saprospiraceae bacterium]
MKGIAFILPPLALLWTSASQNLGAQCVQGDCRNGTGTYLFKNGDRYVGQWAAGLPHGKGTYYFASRERYEGDFKFGKFDGQGTMYYPDNAYYTGGWKENQKNGHGRLVTPDGKVREGIWVAGKLQQETQKPTKLVGESSSPPGNSTSNAGNNGKHNIAGLRNCNTTFCRSGTGYYDYPDGSRWIGEFQNGVPHGKGICYYANGDRYEGHWAKGAPNGPGVLYSGNRATGAVWVNGYVMHEMDSEEVVPNSPVQVEPSRGVKIYAVVVGVGRYTAMPSLRYTDDDAFRFYSFLKSPEGGALPDDQIVILVDENATREKILEKMRQYFLKADKNDVILFFFSGHGLEGCFLPVDYDGFNNKLRHEEIKQILMQSQAKHKLCIADACHSGTLNYGLAAKGPAPVSLSRYYQAFEESSGGIALLMSSKGEELSLEDHGLRQGVFTYYLLRGMKGEANANGDNIITIRELYNYVRTKVREYTANVQNPVLTGAFDDNMPVAFYRF